MMGNANNQRTSNESLNSADSAGLSTNAGSPMARSPVASNRVTSAGDAGAASNADNPGSAESSLMTKTILKKLKLQLLSILLYLIS